MATGQNRVWAIVVAAGRGIRAGGGVPKQWRSLAGARVLDHALAAFSGHPAIAGTLVVYHPDDAARLPAGVEAVQGAGTRAGSVLAGLEALQGRGVDIVLIHDAARPCVRPPLIDAVLDALDSADAAAPALAVTDALWTVDGTGTIAGTKRRDGLARAQTPQGFRYGVIVDAHRQARGDEADDVEVALAAGLDVAAVAGDEDNIKITRPGDFARAERILGTVDIRIGNGYDVHRFGPGDSVTLCGVKVPHDHGLQGHSDADVGMHALTDAIYGALAEGDIGRHFPPTDPIWKGADSAAFLSHAAELARARGYALANADITLVCERPKIGPLAGAMQDRLAGILGVEPGRISVKATTSERLGFTGREEGIAALATVTLVGA